MSKDINEIFDNTPKDKKCLDDYLITPRDELNSLIEEYARVNKITKGLKIKEIVYHLFTEDEKKAISDYTIHYFESKRNNLTTSIIDKILSIKALHPEIKP